MTKFEENLAIAFSESQYELYMRHRETDLEYQQLEQDYDHLFDLIRNKLQKKNRKLMLKLEATGNHKDSVKEDFIYLQGIIDCVKLLKTIKMI